MTRVKLVLRVTFVICLMFVLGILIRPVNVRAMESGGIDVVISDTISFQEEALNAKNIVASGQCGPTAYYTLDSDGLMTVTGTGEITKSSEVANRYSLDNLKVKRVIIENGITRIGDWAFAYEDMETISIPSSVKSIGDYAFFLCESLKSLTIPEGVTSLGESVLGFSRNLELISIPGSVESIPDYFYNNDAGLEDSHLTTLILNNGIKHIGAFAFYMQTAIENLILPDSLETIGKYAFANTGIRNISVPEGVLSIPYAFSGCTELVSASLPNSLQDMTGAFWQCVNLSQVSIPENVAIIDRAFEGCGKITEIYIPDSVTSMNGAFSECYNLRRANSPVNAINMDAAFEFCQKLEGIEIPNHVTSLVRTYRGCNMISHITIPDNVIYLGYNVFANCLQLQSVTLPKSVTKIFISAFYGCEKLTDIYYQGSEAEWNQIVIERDEMTQNEPDPFWLHEISIHFLEEDAASSTRDLAVGMRGEDVRLLQQQLLALGYYDGVLDGDLGAYTEAAIIAFQKANGLYADGLVGSMTRAKLADKPAAVSLQSEKFPSASSEQSIAHTDTISRDLSVGSVGENVIELQRQLAVLGYYDGTVDGDFGAYTEAAVIAFQKANGLYGDGYVGPLTREKLTVNPVAANAAPAQELSVQLEISSQGRELSIGSSGDDVYVLQQQLAALGYSVGAVDGDFGSMTDAAVKAFQADNGLYVDGVVGSITKAALGL